MNVEEFKTEIIEDLKHQLFKKHQRRNWTALHWYYDNPYYDAPKSTITRAVSELMKERRIRLLRHYPETGEAAFEILELIPND